MSTAKKHTPLERLRHHVTGAIERGEKAAIVEQAPDMARINSLLADGTKLIAELRADKAELVAQLRATEKQLAIKCEATCMFQEDLAVIKQARALIAKHS